MLVRKSTAVYPTLPEIQMRCRGYRALHFHLSPLLEYFNVNRVQRYESVYGDMLDLPVPP